MLKGVSQSNGASKSQAESMSVDYLGEEFNVKKEGNKVFVNGEMSYYINSHRQWETICKMEPKYFKTKEKENEVVFVKGCRFIWPTMATGEVMEFEEVLDNVILENKKILIYGDVLFLPVDLSKKSGGKLPKLFNLVGLFFSAHKKTPLPWARYFSFVSAIIFEIKPLRTRIYRISDKIFCGSVQNICNKLPYPVTRFVYLLFMWVFNRLFNSVENLVPRNDILLKVERRDNLYVVIGGSAKTNSKKEATQVDWLDQKEKYEFRCGCSIVMKATYNHGKCTATMQHTNLIPTPEKKIIVNCQSREEFMKIGTFLSCLADSKAGSLFKYDSNDNIVHVRTWRGSLRDYVDAGFPEIYKLELPKVIV